MSSTRAAQNQATLRVRPRKQRSKIRSLSLGVRGRALVGSVAIVLMVGPRIWRSRGDALDRLEQGLCHFLGQRKVTEVVRQSLPVGQAVGHDLLDRVGYLGIVVALVKQCPGV